MDFKPQILLNFAYSFIHGMKCHYLALQSTADNPVCSAFHSLEKHLLINSYLNWEPGSLTFSLQGFYHFKHIQEWEARQGYLWLTPNSCCLISRTYVMLVSNALSPNSRFSSLLIFICGLSLGGTIAVDVTICLLSQLCESLSIYRMSFRQNREENTLRFPGRLLAAVKGRLHKFIVTLDCKVR